MRKKSALLNGGEFLFAVSVELRFKKRNRSDVGNNVEKFTAIPYSILMRPVTTDVNLKLCGALSLSYCDLDAWISMICEVCRHRNRGIGEIWDDLWFCMQFSRYGSMESITTVMTDGLLIFTAGSSMCLSISVVR